MLFGLIISTLYDSFPELCTIYAPLIALYLTEVKLLLGWSRVLLGKFARVKVHPMVQSKGITELIDFVPRLYYVIG